MQKQRYSQCGPSRDTYGVSWAYYGYNGFKYHLTIKLIIACCPESPVQAIMVTIFSLRQRWLLDIRTGENYAVIICILHASTCVILHLLSSPLTFLTYLLLPKIYKILLYIQVQNTSHWSHRNKLQAKCKYWILKKKKKKLHKSHP